MPDYDLIAILGPTASGKTPFAAALAPNSIRKSSVPIHGKSIGGMDLGTGKDLADYTVDGKQIPYHLIDIADPGYKYNVFEYQRDFLNAYETIKQKRLPARCMWRNRNVSRISAERLPSAARTRESRVAHPSSGQIAGRTDRHTERLQKPAQYHGRGHSQTCHTSHRNRRVLCPYPGRRTFLPPAEQSSS